MLKRRVPIVLLIALIIFSYLSPLLELPRVKAAQLGEIDTENFGQGFQRKSFYAQDHFWIFYQNQSAKIYYASSSDGETWDTSNYVRDGSILQFSLWYDGSTYIHTVFTETAYGGDINYTRGEPQSDGTIDWDTEQNVYSSTGWLAWKPTIAIDSSGYPYIYTHWEKDSDYNRLVIKSDNNDGTWSTSSGYPMNLSYYDDEPIPGVILPLTSQKMYVIWAEYVGAASDSNYYGRLYNGSGWEENVTITAALGQYCEGFSAVSKNDEIHLVFPNDEDSPINYCIRYINYTSGSWGSSEVVFESAVKDWQVLSIEDADSEFFIYGNYEEIGEYTYTEYWHGTSGNWGSSTTIQGSNPITADDQITSFRENWGEYHACAFLTMDGTARLEFWYLSDQAPTIGEFQAPATIYANEWFDINHTLNNQDGISEIKNCTVALNSSIVLAWDNSTGSFTINSDPNGYCNLNNSACTEEEKNSTAFFLSWRILLTWSYPQGSIDIQSSNTKVYDSNGASGSGAHSGLFTFEPDIRVMAATPSKTNVDVGESLTLEGSIYYQGKNEAPSNTTGLTAKLETNSSEVGSTSSFSNGSFTISFNAPQTEGTHNYTVYTVANPVSVQNQTFQLYVSKQKGSGSILSSGGYKTPMEKVGIPSLLPKEIAGPPEAQYGTIGLILIMGGATIYYLRKPRTTQQLWKENTKRRKQSPPRKTESKVRRSSRKTKSKVKRGKRT